MQTHLEASIVRIFTNNNTVVGTGFLVTNTSILTCAHVIATALGIAEDTPNMPEGEVRLDFPLIAAGKMCRARTVSWLPPQPSGSDIALVRLLDPSPEHTKVARLVIAKDLRGHDFSAFGFPNRYDDGVWATGKLRRRQATGWIQIEDVKDAGHRVEQGFSGGAVWDEQMDGVVGMIVAEDSNPAIKVAYMFPTDELIKALPELNQQAIPPCPYRGLFAFREQDAAFFFGRETLTKQLVEAVRKKPFAVVIGSSGCGKSSVIFAGLVPQLQQEEDCLSISFRPADRPFQNLASALIPLLEPTISETERLFEVNKLSKHLQQGDFSLRDVVERIIQKQTVVRLLLIVDQFEELYTLSQHAETNQQFLDTLLNAVQAASYQQTFDFSLVITLRADFLGYALSYRPFADALQYTDLKIGPMTTQELLDAIRKPAQKLDVRIEDGLTERILDVVVQAPSNLPLLEFALTLLWARQRENTITHAAYNEIGGVERALASYAEEVFNGFSEEEHRQIQHVFVQLVRPGEGTEDTRRLATRSEIGEEGWHLVVRLSNARLIVCGRDEATGEETAEVVHEALIREWKRLREWIETDRSFRSWQERLRNALRQWEANNRDEGTLLRGVLLAEAKEWMDQRSEAIRPTEQIFIQTSQQWQIQEEQRRKLYEKIENQRQVVLAQQLSNQANLVRTQQTGLLELSVLLALEAMQRFPCLEADQALRAGLASLHHPSTKLIHEGRVNTLAISLDGDCLAAAGTDGIVRVWNVSNGHQLTSLASMEKVKALALNLKGNYLALASNDDIVSVWEVTNSRQLGNLPKIQEVNAIALSPDGTCLAVVSDGGTVSVWDVVSLHPFLRLTHRSDATNILFSPDGKYLATTSDDGTVIVWNLPNGQQLLQLPHKTSVINVAFGSDGSFIATTSGNSTNLWKISSGHNLSSLTHEDHLKAACFEPNQYYLVTVNENDIVKIWSTTDGRLLAYFILDGTETIVTISPDGSYIAMALANGSIRILKTYSGHLLARLQHKGIVWATAFSPDGKYAATASEDNTAGVWEVSSGRLYARLTHQWSVRTATFNWDGSYIVTASADGTAGIWEVLSGRQVARLFHNDEVLDVAFSPDGKFVATASADGTARIWEALSGHQVAHLPHQRKVNTITFSSDGDYLSTASWDRTAGVWEVASGHRIASLRHTGVVWNAVFSPDGRYLATANENRTAEVWEITSGRNLARIMHESAVVNVAFSPDGHCLATASRDRTTYISFWQPEDLISQACSRLTRNLTLKEWKQYLGDEPYNKTCSDLP